MDIQTKISTLASSLADLDRLQFSALDAPSKLPSIFLPLAEAIGVSPETLTGWTEGNGEFTSEQADKILEFLRKEPKTGSRFGLDAFTAPNLRLHRHELGLRVCQDCSLGGRPCACVAFAFGRRCSSLSYHIYSQRRLSARRLRLFLVVLDNQRELVSSLSEFLLDHLRAKGSALWIGGVESR